MPEFGTASRLKLKSLEADLQTVLLEAIKEYDFAIIWGYRGEKSQNDAYATGHSRLKFPESKHNTLPSRAVDLAPYPINWDNTSEFYYLAGIIMSTANRLGIPLTWGGRWQKLKDLGHFELKETPPV